MLDMISSIDYFSDNSRIVEIIILKITNLLVAKQTNFIMFIKENIKRMLIYQHSFLFQMYSRN